MVLPSLAAQVGLNEAIILQQIHYWLDPRINKNFKEGYYWVYNSYEQWGEQFSFWSTVTIKRTFQSLEKSGLLISKNLNHSGFNKTKWYRLDYEKLKELTSFVNESKCSSRSDQNDPSKRSACTQDQINVISSYMDTEITTDNSFPPISSIFGSENRKKEKKIKSYDLKGNGVFAQNMMEVWAKTVGKETGGREPLFNRPVREKKLLDALHVYFENDLYKWEKYCSQLTTSKFLMGETKESFKINIDWAIKPQSIERILDGSISLEDRTVFTSTEEGLESARKTYDTLSSTEMAAYKEEFVLLQQKKNPSFSIDELPFVQSQFRHFVLTKILRAGSSY